MIQFSFFIFKDDVLTDKFAEPYYYLEVEIKKVFEKERPDVIIVDSNGVCPPALTSSGIPWALIYCSNPLGVLRSKDLPPPTSGYPTHGDKSLWPEYWQWYE